jgi:hypothetical protein
MEQPAVQAQQAQQVQVGQLAVQAHKDQLVVPGQLAQQVLQAVPDPKDQQVLQVPQVQ